MSMTISSQEAETQTPDVSVIIPTYNRIAMLEEALASVTSQDFDGVVEIIVIDDNSQDGTSEIVSQKYPDVHLISLQENVGAYVARNKAVLEAKGKYIAFLDSDDFWEKNYLKSQIAALKGKDRCFCASAIVIWNTVEGKKKIKLQKPNLTRFKSPIHQLLAGWNFIGTPSSVVFPRQVFDEVGLFDETCRVGGDNDLYARCLIAGYEPIFTEQPVVICRKHDKGQLTNAKYNEVRLKSRLERLNKLYPVVEKHFDVASISHIRAEVYTTFASNYFRKNCFIPWFILSIKSANYASPRYALFNMMRDLKRSSASSIRNLILVTKT